MGDTENRYRFSTEMHGMWTFCYALEKKCREDVQRLSAVGKNTTKNALHYLSKSRKFIINPNNSYKNHENLVLFS